MITYFEKYFNCFPQFFCSKGLKTTQHEQDAADFNGFHGNYCCSSSLFSAGISSEVSGAELLPPPEYEILLLAK